MLKASSGLPGLGSIVAKNATVVGLEDCERSALVVARLMEFSDLVVAFGAVIRKRKVDCAVECLLFELLCSVSIKDFAAA